MIPTTADHKTAEARASAEPRSKPTVDLFQLARDANETRLQHFGRVGFFCRSRQLLATGVWRGPRDAPDAYIEAADARALGDWHAVAGMGVRLVLAPIDADAIAAITSAGLRCVVRVPYAATDTQSQRQEAIGAIRRLVENSASIESLLPTPVGESMGLDTLGFFAQLRLAAPRVHLAADFALLGHRLAQMALGFGADQLFGPLVAERSLRVGDNAGNPAMTRKEAALLLSGAGLEPHERLAGSPHGRLEAYQA